VVAAAGNSNVNLAAAAVYPASIDSANVITVGASNADETKASYSNYGTPVELFAPGSLILSTVPGGYSFMSGTSMAAPMVAGIAANVLAANPGLAAPAVRDQLIGTADEVAAYQTISSSGTRLNAARAVGINPDAAEASVAIRGLAAATVGSITAEIDVVGGDLIDQPYQWEATLIALTPSGPFGIVDHPVTVGGQQLTTDGRGAVPLSDTDASAISLAAGLPDGSYALLIEAVSTEDAGLRIGDGFVATFDLSDPGAGGGDGGDGATTTTLATTTTTLATTTTIATTTAPAPTTTTTIAPPTITTAPTTTAGPTTTTPSTVATTTAPGDGTTTVPGPTSTTAPSSTTQTTTQTTTSPTTGAPAPTTAPTTVPTDLGTPSSTSSPTPTTEPPATNPSTTAPTTTIQTTTIPATTVAPTTTATTAPTTTIADDTGTWFVDRIAPASGPTSVKSTVSVTGYFPDDAYVWFGNQAGEVIYRTSTWILVQTPAVVTPGPVDLRVRKGSIDLVVPDGFTFFDPVPDPTPQPTTSTTTKNNGPTTTAVGATTSTTSGPTSIVSTSTIVGDTSTTTPGGGATSTTSGATSTTPGQTTTTTSGATSTSDPATSTTAAATTTTTAPAVPPQQRSLVLGPAIDLGDGVQGVPLGGLSGLDTVPRCASDPCRIRKV
ncbi:MAG: S8 family serine peptidase, partial [Actinomycetota bacterium]